MTFKFAHLIPGGYVYSVTETKVGTILSIGQSAVMASPKTVDIKLWPSDLQHEDDVFATHILRPALNSLERAISNSAS